MLHLLRLPKTPAVRVPRHKERVYSISVNGSPIAAGNDDIVINIPSSNGEVSAQSCCKKVLDPTFCCALAHVDMIKCRVIC